MDTENSVIHLQDIERPEYMNRRVRIPITVVGVGKTFSVPSKVKVRCNGDDDEALCFRGSNTIALNEPTFWLRCLDQSEEYVRKQVTNAAKRTARCGHVGVGKYEATETITQVVVCPDFHELAIDTASGNLVDELGRDWKRVPAFYIGTIESKSEICMAEGTIVAHPRTQEITFVIDDLRAVDAEDTQLEPVPLNYDQLEEILSKLERVTAVKGRPNAHLWMLLLYTTPLCFTFDGERIEGWGKGLFFGDSTTGKGQVAK